MKREDIRNIAIIAHVDHGKTTLVDQMLRQSGTFRENQVVAERVMDSQDLERERGITILAKNTAVHYKGVKLNIIDTPGHADFGGEVERILKMVDGVILLVDAYEGPMPQTRFVLQKALDLDHRVVVLINKMDRPDARPNEVVDEVLELFMELEASDEQLDSPFVYASARSGSASLSPDEKGTDLKPLFDTILDHIPSPEGDEKAPLQLLVSTLDYNDYVGRIAVGKVERGTIATGQELVLCNHETGKVSPAFRVSSLFEFDGLDRVPVKEAPMGDIVALSGVEGIMIGDTVCPPDVPEPLPFVKISVPTVVMTFCVNDSPFAGREGKYVTSRHLRDRLMRETLSDVSLRVTEINPDTFEVAGRGELHLSILIETMRRQGYEFQVSKPMVVTREENGKLLEPIERLVVDVPDACSGTVIEALGRRKGEMINMHQSQGSRVRMEFLIPSRGLFGYRPQFMTDTRGEGIMNTIFHDYEPFKGELEKRSQGSLIAFETGDAVSYGLFNAQGRGQLYIGPGTKVYAGMVVGSNSRQGDMEVNVCKKKHVTNMRASGSDEALRLVPPKILSLEEALEVIAGDELLEVTPENFRIRKRILDSTLRMRSNRREQS
ncbi:translational GTPase TypA [Gehongia tenuis]|uniref:Large ribosomal subunit assembly factor BipA n=1 Tax=Gehongia tenuis TaxID=2763655 RepID=A0A926HQ56_9FIRM|nr:translational GTPase TypA [Gehongia tenuis]MBC8531395.1 translational GTPase TypA [Gehongia tenuis]